MPWLAGTALLHSAIVMEKRSALKIWTLLLAILTFSLSLLGTVLVRSGVLTSVHAFASDPTRGVFILCILIFFIGGSLALFAWRAPSLTAGGLFQPISREGALVLNNLFLTTAAATVLVGTLYPLVIEALSANKISVGAPFFDLTFGPLMVPLLLVVPFGPLLAWKRGDLLAAAQRLMAAFGAALLAMLVTYLFIDGASVFAALGAGLAFWLICGALTDLAVKSGTGTVPLSIMAKRFAGLPRSIFGTALAHLGLGLTLLGIVGTLNFGAERILTMHAGETVDIAGYALRFDGLYPQRGPNYTENRGRFELVDTDGASTAEISSSKRLFPVRQTTTTEAGIRTIWFSQLYVSLGDETNDGGVVVRIWWKPLVTLIWGGALVMMAGGAISLADRRLRVGAPARRRKSATTSAAGVS
jgi:cytochrome c-type biogenesis protein CcmF